jgi:hypothetical protein
VEVTVSKTTDRRVRPLVLAVLGVCGLMLTGTGSAAAATTTGTWSSYPPQTSTTQTTTSAGTPAYKTAVRPPINADGTSNFSGKRGVIPVQFDLLAAPTTTTTTTKTYNPPVWESIGSDTATANDFSFAALNLNPTLTFAQITNLSADYQFTTGDCFGGSLRWDVFLDNAVGVIHIYYGDPGGVQSCSGAASGSGQNLITTGATNRFEIGNTGVYTTYAAAALAAQGGNVTRVQLTLDSGWKSDQKADVSNVTVNDNTWVPKTTETTTSTAVTGPYATTCNLPAAELRWSKDDATPSGAINEGESVQPKDTGQYFRQVDCKYIYNLDVSYLSGAGTYRVYARINGQNLADPAVFDLR